MHFQKNEKIAYFFTFLTVFALKKKRKKQSVTKSAKTTLFLFL